MTSPVFAQEAPHVRPLFGITQTYDSNLFGRPTDREAYFVMRLTPGVEAEHNSPRVQLVSRYSVDVEHQARHTAMTTVLGRHGGLAGVRYTQSRRLLASFDASFTRTQTPGELSTVSGLTLGRAAAERFELRPKFVRNLGGLTAGTLEYTYTRDWLAGAGRMRAHLLGLGLDRQVSRRDRVGVAYEAHQMFFEPGPDPLMHRVRLAWTRPLTRLVDVALQAGAASTGREAAPDLRASIEHRTRPTTLAMSYARTQTTVVGSAGVVDTETVTATGSLRPRPRLEFRLVPGVSRMRQGGGGHMRAWHVALETERHLTGGLLRVSYDVSEQRGQLFSVMPMGTVSRHAVQVTFFPRSLCEICDTTR